MSVSVWSHEYSYFVFLTGRRIFGMRLQPIGTKPPEPTSRPSPKTTPSTLNMSD